MTVTNNIFNQQSTNLDSQELQTLESSGTEYRIAMHVTFKEIKGTGTKITNKRMLRISR